MTDSDLSEPLLQCRRLLNYVEELMMRGAYQEAHDACLELQCYAARCKVVLWQMAEDQKRERI